MAGCLAGRVLPIGTMQDDSLTPLIFSSIPHPLSHRPILEPAARPQQPDGKARLLCVDLLHGMVGSPRLHPQMHACVDACMCGCMCVRVHVWMYPCKVSGRASECSRTTKSRRESEPQLRCI